MKGEIFKWFEDKGYGFINGLDGESYFLHVKQMKEEVTPEIGDKVKFEIVETEKGKQAHNVVIM